HDHDGDKALEKKQKLALRDEIRLASFIDQFGDFPHRAMNRQILQAGVDGQSEDQTKNAECNAEEKQRVSVNSKKFHLRQIGKHQVRFAPRSRSCLLPERRKCSEHNKSVTTAKNPRNLAELRAPIRKPKSPGQSSAHTCETTCSCICRHSSSGIGLHERESIGRENLQFQTNFCSRNRVVRQ